MRNLSLLASEATSLNTNSSITGTAIDVDENVVYVSSESEGGEVEIYRVGKDGPQLMAMFTSASVTARSSTSGDAQVQVISLRIVQETRTLVAVMRNGDITGASLDDEDMRMETEGTIEDGILAASWSPDDSLLVVVTGSSKIILMTPTFDVIFEGPMNTTEFGENAPINVGWGSKETQFHGSAGKAAAKEPSIQGVVWCSPDDDHQPRISWRADGACFVVSSVSVSGSRSHHHRALRVYTHQGVLQSTSEPVPGLEHGLAWRPVGNLIASTQRFGGEGLGSGPEGKHDVVFFERNGLRHGEFGLRPQQGLKGDVGQQFPLRRWGYRVKELLWSSDSNVLAIWFERDGFVGDLVQLWTTGNYHWYLKQEISALSSANSDSPSPRFTSVQWHPTEALKLISTTPTQLLIRTYTYETFASPTSKPPMDSGSVAVVDGSSLLLTPFRTQNVPPPMCSARLDLDLDLGGLPDVDVDANGGGARGSGMRSVRVPIHASFSESNENDNSASEFLGVLWERGYVEVYDLRTRLGLAQTGKGKGKGKGKVMNPIRIATWSSAGGREERKKGGGYRQIVMLDGRTMVLLGSSLGEGGGEREGEGEGTKDVDIVSVVRFKVDESTRMQTPTETRTISMPSRNGRLVLGGSSSAEEDVLSNSEGWGTWQDANGGLYRFELGFGGKFSASSETATTTTVEPFGRFTEYCAMTRHVSVSASGHPTKDKDLNLDSEFCLGLTSSGKLLVIARSSTSSSSKKASQTLATNVNSFTIASGYLIYTVYTGTNHEAIFVPLHSEEGLVGLLGTDKDDEEVDDTLPIEKADPLILKSTQWEKRRIERGSRIVVGVPSSMGLVLQMPRGNLETINPRPLVSEVVRGDLDRGEYRKAFFACRKHRIDLNFLVRHDETAFLDRRRLESFVEQVHEVDHLNLFLTSLGEGLNPLGAETIAKISDALRERLERKDLKTYVNTVLTAHVVKSPPDHESALAVLLRLKGTEPALVEDAVKYVIFLVDANKLFDTALGMYDFELVLMVAQHSQKDPREYLPFLRELRAVDNKNYQKFRIDDHLKRYTSALRNLAGAGPKYFDEAIQYVERYSLYEDALEMWDGTDRYGDVLAVYGDWLFERREFRQAAAVFVEAKSPQKAMVAYEKALEWQDLFELALRHPELVSEEDVEAMAYRVSEDLVSKKRFAEAARVILDYTTDTRTAVITLVQGNEFSEALRIATLKRNPELVEDVIHPGALESRAQIDEDLTEMKEQLRKQLNRVRELRVKKVEEPDEFYGVEDTALHNVDVMTDVSMAPTAFTRYTIAPSTTSRMSKRSSRSKRKIERKVGSGRKGTVDEEEYLLRSVGKLVSRFSATREAESKRLLPHLFKFTANHREEGLAMQRELSEFEAELGVAVEEIWAGSLTTSDHSDGQTLTAAPAALAPLQDSWAARMEETERQRKINPVERVPKPQMDGDVDGKDWKMRLFERRNV